MDQRDTSSGAAGRPALRWATRGLAVALIAATAGLAPAGCGADAEIGPIGQVALGITHGTVYMGHPAVGLLSIELNTGAPTRLCTGTLVGTRTVLTAAHCAEDARQITFELDTSGSGAGEMSSYIVTEIKMHPDYVSTSTGSQNDVAVLRINEAPPVAPAMLAATAPSEGLPATLVGFGLTGNNKNDGGIKRLGTNVVDKVDPREIELGTDGQGNFCLGDSGAPTFARLNGPEVQIGVMSYLINDAYGNPCTDDGRSMRVDIYLPWIQEAARGDVNASSLPDQMSAGSSLYGDRTPPTVAILAPQSETVVGSRLTIKSTVEDDVSVRAATLLVDGQVFGERNLAPYDFDVFLQPGSHQIAVVGEDELGNSSQQTLLLTVIPGGDSQQDVNVSGCNITSTSAGGSQIGWILLGLVGLVARRRRRRA